MVGVCGVLGCRNHSPDRMLERLQWRDDERRSRFVDDDVCLAGSFHELLDGETPAPTSAGDVLVWVWGDVYGHFGPDGYVPRERGSAPSDRYVADLYDEADGSLDFADLNGDYLALLYDTEARTLTFVTDRVASRPAFYATDDEGTTTFSSNIQSLASHPGVDVQFDVQYLYEYLVLRRVFGVKTPLKGVEELPPASSVTFDLDDGSTTVDQYWRPTHRPTDESYGTYVDQFVDLFETVVDEWTTDDLDYGVLLSGGSDSRVALAAMDDPDAAFHIADWQSPEARVAERVAETADVDFRLLERGPHYHANALTRNPPIANFSGWFDQAYFTGFAEEIQDQVDVLVSGLYSDMLFKGGPLSTPRISLGRIGSISPPIWKGVDSIDEYVKQQTAAVSGPPSFVTPPLDIDAVLRNNVAVDGDRIESHGVTFESLRDLVMYGDFFPMGADTDAIFSRSLMHMCPYRTPFLDARILEFQQRIPLRYFLRRNLIHRAVEQIAPELAEIPHSRTGVPLKYPYLLDHVGDHVNGFRRKHLSRTTPPKPHLTHGPWSDRGELMRQQDFVRERIRDSEELIREMPFLDYEGVEECYQDHLDGADNAAELYSLATLLGTPAIQQARESDRVATRVPAHLGVGPNPISGLTGGGKQ